MISEQDIPRIDVRETLVASLGDPQCVNTILRAIEQERKGEPIERPPEDLFDLMIYAARQDALFTYADSRENTPDKLMDFVKASPEFQRKVLFRCVFVFQKFFTFVSARRRFPIQLKGCLSEA